MGFGAAWPVLHPDHMPRSCLRFVPSDGAAPCALFVPL